jgi:hypothetical protein
MARCKWLIVALLLANGCATWKQDVNSSMNYASQAGDAIRISAGPLVDIKCNDEAVRCIAAGITTPEKCAAWLQCNKTRRAIGLGLIALQAAILDGAAALAIDDEPTAREAINRALELIAQIRAQLKEMGVL